MGKQLLLGEKNHSAQKGKSDKIPFSKPTFLPYHDRNLLLF